MPTLFSIIHTRIFSNLQRANWWHSGSPVICRNAWKCTGISIFFFFYFAESSV